MESNNTFLGAFQAFLNEKSTFEAVQSVQGKLTTWFTYQE